MKNRGYVTVFVTMLLAVMMIIVMAVLQITDESHAKTKSVTALSSAMSSELAEFNPYVYDRYHILLLDRNSAGQGEEAMVTDMKSLLEYDLGDKFSVGNLEISKIISLMDDDCKEFDRQIRQNFKYDAADYTAEKILQKTSGNDTPVDDETISEMEEDIGNEQSRIEAETEDSESDDSQSEDEEEDDDKEKDNSEESVEDPRKALKAYTDAGIAVLILPEEVKLSSEEVPEDLPSKGRGIFTEEDIDTDFNDKGKLETDSMKGNGWSTSLMNGAETLVYASKYFNCLTDQPYDDTALNLEMEYLAVGGKNDGENYRRVVNRILLIRFGFNFAYILTDPVRMAKCDALALSICAGFPPMQPVVKFLLAGCWSYIESIADVYLLLRNHKVPFFKTTTTWETDFESLSHLDSIQNKSEDDEKGLDYKDYMIILMALQGNNLKYRILDLIQINTNKNNDETFRIKNAITAFGVNAEISYGSKDFSLYEETGY